MDTNTENTSVTTQVEYADFMTHMKCLAVEKRSSAKAHHYTVQEDMVAYYCALTSFNSKDKLDVMVMKMNRISKSDLKLPSFQMRVANMAHAIYGKGKANNSEQGKAIALYVNKLRLNNRLNSVALKGFINTFYGEDIF